MKLKHNFLFEEFQDDGSGNGGGTPEFSPSQTLYGQDTDDIPDEHSNREPAEPAEPATPTGTPQFDAKFLADSIVDGLTRAQRANQPAAPQRTLTEDEFRQQTGYYSISDEEALEVLGGDPETIGKRKQTLQRIIDSNAQHAIKVASLLISNKEQAINQRLEPLTREQESRAKDMFFGSIVKSQPALKGKEELIDLAYSRMASSGYVSQGAEQDKKNLIEVATKLAKAVDPNFSLQTPTNSGNRGGSRSAGAFNSAGSGGTNRVQKQPLKPGQALYQKVPAGK